MKTLTSTVVADVRVGTHALVHKAQCIAWTVIVFLALHDVKTLCEGIRIGNGVWWTNTGVGPWGVRAHGSQSTGAGSSALVHV